MLKKYLCITISMILTGTYCIASPSIDHSDSIYNNYTTTVKGDKFGVKKNAPPLLFENFEKNTEGLKTTAGNTVPEELPYWTGRGGMINGLPKDITISDENARHIYSSKSAKAYLEVTDGSPSHAQQAWTDQPGLASTGKIYANMWIYWQWVQNPIYRAGDSYYQIKAFNISAEHEANGMPVTPFITEFIGYWYEPPSFSSTYTQSYHRAGRVTHSHHLLNYNNNSIPPDFSGWLNIVLISDTGTNINDASITDGWRVAYISHPQRKIPYQKKTETEKNYLDAESKGPHPISSIKIGWFLGHNLQSGNTTLYYDDIYIDNTFARIEIGNAEEYDSCTHREIQIPIFWDENEIKFQANIAAFNKEEALYLFVFNKNNEANLKGHKLTVRKPVEIDSLIEIP